MISRRTVHVVLCLVLFTAFMEGLRFLLVGIDRQFGAGMGLGGFLGLGIVALIIDRDCCPESASWISLGFVVGAAVYFGSFLNSGMWNSHLPIGALTGFGIAFPIFFWAVGDERKQRGFPRPPLFQRASRLR